MSVTIEDKIELFSKMIFSKIEVQSSERRQNAIGKYEEELAKLQKEIQSKKLELIDAAATKAERERTRLLAQLKNQEQRRLVESKQQFVERVMKMLYGYAARLAATEEYKSILKKAVENVSKAFDDSRLVHFYVLPNEFDIFERVLQENRDKFPPDFKYAIEAAPMNILGGFIAEDKEKLLEIDHSMRTLVEEHRDAVGAAITRKFDEVSSYE